MRTAATEARGHPATAPLPDEHHPRPAMVEFSSAGLVSLPPGTTYDLDVALSSASFKVATVHLMGPALAGLLAAWRECASVHVTADVADAVAHSVRSISGSTNSVYNATYSKQAGDTVLTYAIFDSVTGPTSMYIALIDVWITGAILRLRFRNFFGGSAFLWVKGSALLW